MVLDEVPPPAVVVLFAIGGLVLVVALAYGPICTAMGGDFHMSGSIGWRGVEFEVECTRPA